MTHSDPRNIVFRLKGVPFIDVTGLETFSEVIEAFHRRGVTVFLCEANPKVARKIIKMGIAQWIYGCCIFGSLAEVVKNLRTST